MSLLQPFLDEDDRKTARQLVGLALVAIPLLIACILALAAAAGLAVRLFGLLAG